MSDALHYGLPLKNNGRVWRPKGEPEQVNVHDFIYPALPRAVPYGIYDLTNNALDLGIVGLMQFVPLMALAIFVGQIHPDDATSPRLCAFSCAERYQLHASRGYRAAAGSRRPRAAARMGPADAA